MTRGYIFSDDEAKRVAAAVYANEGRPPYQLPPRPRPIRAGGGGACTCQEIWCFLPLAPSAGTWDMDLTVNGTQETLTFDWNETQSGFSAELVTHSEVTGSDFELAGGSFPSVAIYLTWLLADDDILDTFPTIDTSSLTGDVTMFKFSLGRGL